MHKQKTLFALFIIVLLAGISFRLYDLNWESFGYGEVEVYQAVGEFLKGNFTRNFYIYAETPLLKYIFTLFAFLGGLSEVSLRLVSVAFGSGSIAMAYLVTQKLYKEKWLAVFAALFTSFSLIHIQFSRYIQFEAALSFFFLLSLYLFLNLLEKRTNKNALFFGISIGAGMLIKTAFLSAVVALIIFSLIYKMIRISFKGKFSLEIDGKLLKALAVAVITFFVLWPIALLTLPVNITVDVDGRVNEINANVPHLLLVFGYRFSEAGKAVTDNFFLSLPVVGNFMFFLVKENIIFVAAFFAGLYAMKRGFLKQDRDILIFLAVFFLLLSVQDIRYTYRYITMVVPFLAIVAARSIYLTDRKKEFFAAAFVLMAIFAALAAPNYALYYNPINSAMNIPPAEGRFGEGMRETINAVEDCNSILAQNFYVFMLEPYRPGAASPNATDPDCAIRGVNNGFDESKISEFISNNSCTLKEEIIVKGQKLVEVFGC